MKTSKIIGALLCVLTFGHGFAQVHPLSQDSSALQFELPVFDLPFQSYASKTTGNFFSGYANPGMPLSLALSNNFYTAAHYGIVQLVKPKNDFLRNLLTYGSVAVFDYVSMWSPLGTGWLHEEYHRAVLTWREINSFNDMNTFPIGRSAVYVRKIKDEDLVKLSDSTKPDFIRLQAAGLEAQYHQIQQLQKNNFYQAQALPHLPLYWLSTFNNIVYVLSSSSPEEFDSSLDEANKKEATDISARDFTGPDFTAWVSALYNPDRPYEARGIHPYGIGLNRYIKPSDLDQNEIEYLRKQAGLQLINLLSPALFGFSKIKLKSSSRGNYYGNFAIRHLLTSFGNDISLDVFYKSPKNKLFLSFHNYNNLNASFYGIEGALIDKQIDRNLLLSGRLMVWNQPKDQSFLTTEGSPGGLIGLRTSYLTGVWAPYAEIEWKSPGWVMGNVFLDQNFSFRAGISLRLPQAK